MWIALPLFAALVLAAAVSDVRSRRVSNRLNLAILMLGLGWRATTLDASTTLAGLLGVAVGLGVLLVPFAWRWVGAGDVKLLAACGAWLGPWDALLAGLFGVAGGGLLSLVIAIGAGAGVRREVARNVGASILTMTAPVAPQRAKAQIVPLAVPLAAAALAVFLVRGLS
jgi:prepilin peptidase CpaA